MNLYLDTSGLVKLYVQEAASADVPRYVEAAGVVATSRVAYPGAGAALARRTREGHLTPADRRCGSSSSTATCRPGDRYLPGGGVTALDVVGREGALLVSPVRDAGLHLLRLDLMDRLRKVTRRVTFRERFINGEYQRSTSLGRGPS